MTTEQRLAVISRAAAEFRGQLTELEKAVGMYVLGPQFGWRVMYLVHDKKTIAKYEGILGVNIREEFPERGPLAHRSVALRAADRLGNFWKAVKGGAAGVRTPDIQDD